MLNNRNGIEEIVYVIIKQNFIMQITCLFSLPIFHISRLLMFAQIIIQCRT